MAPPNWDGGTGGPPGWFYAVTNGTVPDPGPKRTNDYAGAQILLYGLLRQDLTPEKKQAVSRTTTEVNERMLAAVQKSDPPG